jgi:multidrug efflux pump subunit AcrA (membrane-fusion protein)
MTAEVNIVVSKRDGVLVAPMESIDGRFVWVIDGGRAQRREVTLGIHDLLATEVLAGVSEGDMLVVDGQGALTDGARVSTRPAPPSLPPPATLASVKR